VAGWFFAVILVAMTIAGIAFVVMDCRPGHDGCLATILGHSLGVH
jgi:hypothetical protein